MAPLPQEDQDKIVRQIQKYWSRLWEECNFSKAELATAVAEIDVWFDDNQADANNSISEPFQSNASTDQKAMVIVAVVSLRYGSAELIDLLFGGL